MIYSKFTLENFRSFKGGQTLQFAIPSGKVGSGLTYIVGANNAGKTSSLEAMQFKHGDMLNRSDQASKERASIFKFYDADSNCVREVKNRVGHYLLEAPSNMPVDDDTLPFFIPSRRHWHTRIQQPGQIDYSWLVSQSHANSLRVTEGFTTVVDVASLLKSIESNPKQYEELIKIARKIIPDFDGYAATHDEYNYIEYHSGNSSYKSSYSGEGIASVLRIIANIILSVDRPVVIDEPELSLHPLAKKRLAEWLGLVSTERQIVIATHDPYFVSWDYILNGATVNHLIKNEEGETEIHRLNNLDRYAKLIKNCNDWHRPQMMDLLSREIFFCDNILFLEGQEDVGLLRSQKAINEELINIFDYGIGGIEYANASFALAHDLGLKKVGIILDNGERENNITKELREKYPDYAVIKWNKADIRDKYDETKKTLVKEGYFDTHGALKPKDQLDDYYEKLAMINKYYEP